MKVYLDNGATTKVDPEVAKAMLPYFKKKYGNASSLHSFGREAAKALEKSRETIAKLLNVQPEEIIFTSCGSESNNLAIKGVISKEDHIITSAIEHPSVKEVCEQYPNATFIKVNNDGFVNPEDIEAAIKPNTKLVTIMHANNEIGTIQPIEKIAEICKRHDILFHTDAVQTFGKIPLNLENIDMASFSAHKIHGPKGIGVLYIKKGTKLNKQIHGGPQEFGLRAGTENIAYIVGMAKAAELAYNYINNNEMKRLRDKLIDGVLKIEKSWLHGSKKNRLPNNVNLGFSFIEGESLVIKLDEKGIATSTGSACSSHKLELSHVLKAIGMKQQDVFASLRLTLSRYTTEEEIDYVIKVLPEVIKDLRKMSPFGGKNA